MTITKAFSNLGYAEGFCTIISFVLHTIITNKQLHNYANNMGGIYEIN
ncbi:hypothetical protein [Limosilactobacillus reuteri]|nr:hypothetical protein [Limosilactobacillus reuteri]